MHPSILLTTLALPLLTTAAPRNIPVPPRLPQSLPSRQTNTPTCNLATTPQPSNTLTPPTTGLTLVLIAQGHGTQNYTCTNATAVPAAIGAVASLFNASCSVASGASLSSISESASAIGAHFFVDSTTPEFDIIGLGDTQAKKVESMVAPVANAVPWLKLEATVSATTGPVREIYRLNTEGGVAPATCEGVVAGGTVKVEYSAQYWIYAVTAEVARRRRQRERRDAGLAWE